MKPESALETNLEHQCADCFTRADLINFIGSLKYSLTHEPELWENHTLEHYLDSLGGWIADMDGYFANINQAVDEQPSWNLIARCSWPRRSTSRRSPTRKIWLGYHRDSIRMFYRSRQFVANRPEPHLPSLDVFIMEV